MTSPNPRLARLEKIKNTYDTIYYGSCNDVQWLISQLRTELAVSEIAERALENIEYYANANEHEVYKRKVEGALAKIAELRKASEV